MLSCNSGYGMDWDEDTIYFSHSEDFAPLDTIRSRKCFSCGRKIKPGDMALMFSRFRRPSSEYEERRFGDEVYLADAYFCEECGEIYFNLTGIGYEVLIGDMREALLEYWEIIGFDPFKYSDKVVIAGLELKESPISICWSCKYHDSKKVESIAWRSCTNESKESYFSVSKNSCVGFQPKEV